MTEPKTASEYLDRGCDKDDKKDSKGAIEDYSKAIEINPSYAEAYANRGCAKEELGDIEGAISDWEEAVYLGDEEAEKWIKELSPSLRFADREGVCKNEALNEVMGDLKQQYEDDPETVARALGYVNANDEVLLERFKIALKKSGIGERCGRYKIYAESIICEDDDHGGSVIVPTAEVNKYKGEISADFEPYDQEYIMLFYDMDEKAAKEELDLYGEPMSITHLRNIIPIDPATLEEGEWFDTYDILEYYGLDSLNINTTDLSLHDG